MIDLNKWYGDFHVLRDINLKGAGRRAHRDLRTVRSGKSTMIRCINRLEEHQSGQFLSTASS